LPAAARAAGVSDLPNDAYTPYRESRHHIFLIPSDKLAGSITPENLGRWLGHMDAAYEAYVDLIGFAPDGGQKIIWRDQGDGDAYGAMWAYVGGHEIGVANDLISYYFSQVNDLDEYGWGPLHEMGHNFDKYTDPNWIFHGEFTANLKAVYAIDVLGARTEMDGEIVTTLDGVYKYSYKWAIDDKGEDKRYNDKLMCSFIDFARDYGWDAFKKAFRSYYDDSYPYAGQKYVGSESGVRLHELVDRLSYYSGVDVAAKYINNRWPECLTEGYADEGYDYSVESKSDYFEQFMPAQITAFNNHYYARYDIGLTWKDAELFCESIGGKLITITSEQEQAFAQSILSNAKNDRYWIGATNAGSTSGYHWVTGETWGYSNWEAGQPSNGEQDCAAIQITIFDWMRPHGWNQYQWDDIAEDADDQLTGFICEWDSKGAIDARAIAPSDWAKAEVEAAIGAGIVPDSVSKTGWTNATSRLAAAEATVAVIEKAAGKTMAQLAAEKGWDLSKNGFSDTDSQAVTFLKYAEITNGVGDNKYDPYAGYTRAQTVTMIGRTAEVFFGKTAKGTNPFTDVPDWAAPYVGYAADTGVTNGVGGGKFDSDGVLQNQQTAIFCLRAFKAWNA
jgi:hypothetical protein